MTVTKNSGWPVLRGSTLSDFFDDDRFTNNSVWLRGQNLPAVNVKENEKGYEIEVAAPGFSKTDFTISIDGGLLVVSAEKRQEREEKDESYTSRQFGYTSFSRSFNLPPNTGENDIQAKYEEGILRLSIPKKNHSESKTKIPIEIK